MLESQWAWVEQFAYQMTQLPKEVADIELGGLTAMAKAQAGIVLNECAQCAQLLFGGNGYTKSGQGELVESKSCTSAGRGAQPKLQLQDLVVY
jgi:acyl-CoA dehydrogenase